MLKSLSIIAVAGLLAGCAGNTEQQNAFSDSSACAKAPLSQSRSLYVCKGGAVNLDKFKRSLISKADPNLDAKEIGRTFDLPAPEISGVLSASARAAGLNSETPDIIQVNRRTFAVYKRDGATIFVERR